MKSKPSVERNHWVSDDNHLQMLYYGIVENALACIITMDTNGTVVEFNPAAEEVFAPTTACQGR